MATPEVQVLENDDPQIVDMDTTVAFNAKRSAGSTAMNDAMTNDDTDRVTIRLNVDDKEFHQLTSSRPRMIEEVHALLISLFTVADGRFYR